MLPAAAMLRLQVPGEAAALEPARLAVMAHLREALGAEPPPRLAYRVELVLEEALMNRAWHAWPDGGRHHTVLCCEVRADEVVLRFDDDGVAFDPLRAAAPALPATLDEARPGGLGLMLTRKAASALHYERRDGRNLLTVHLARG
jgi:anti-sigma regulatory factor (Ser/Thr protein kinase)